MKPTIGVALSALLLIPGCGLAVVGAGQTITGSGLTKEVTRKVGPFRQVVVSATFEATITIGPEPSVTLAVDDNLLDLVEVRVRDGRLEVKHAEGPIIVTTKPQKVKIVATGLDSIRARGAAKVTATVGEGEAIRIEVEGAAWVELRGLAHTSVAVKEAGAGRVTLEGKAKALTLTASGSSRLRAEDATFESAEVAIEGTSRCELNVTGSITGEATGAGSLTILGNPPARSVKSSGVSRVIY